MRLFEGYKELDLSDVVDMRFHKPFDLSTILPLEDSKTTDVK